MSASSAPDNDPRPIIKSVWKARLKIASTVGITILLALFLGLNRETATLDLVFHQFALPAGLLYILILLVGVLLGILSGRQGLFLRKVNKRSSSR